MNAPPSRINQPRLTFLFSQRANRSRNHRGQGRRREPRNDYPRDGVRKVGFSPGGSLAFFMSLC